MGFFAAIIRDSQRPPPAARSTLSDRSAAAVVIPTDGHPAKTAEGPSEPGRKNTVTADPEGRKSHTAPLSLGHGPTHSTPPMSSARKPLVPSSADTIQPTGSVETATRYNDRSEPVMPPSAGPPEQRAATGLQTKKRTRRRNEPVFIEPLSDQALGKKRKAESSRRADDRRHEPVESLNESISLKPGLTAQPVTAPLSSASNLPPAEAAPPMRPASGAAASDNIPHAAAAPDANTVDAPLPLEAKPHTNEAFEMPMPRSAVADTNTREQPMPAAVILTPMEQPPDASPERKEDGFTAREESAAIMPSVAAVPAPQHERERTGQAPNRPAEAPGAEAEAPAVRIGLLEVVVTAPESPPRKAERTLGIRNHIASRHYLRNL